MARRGFLRPRRHRGGDGAGVRHLSRLPPLLQSVRQLPPALRHGRRGADGRGRRGPQGSVRQGRGGVHPLRHVLHDQVPLCAAAPVQCGLPSPDAAPPRRGAEGPRRRVRPRAAGRDGPQRQAGQADRRPRQLGQRSRQRPDPAGHGGGARNRPRRGAAEVQFQDGAGPLPHPAQAQPRRPRLRPAQGRGLRHLLCRLQRAPDGGGRAEGAGAPGRGGRARLSRMLRHAPARGGRHRRRGRPRRAGVGRTRRLDRQGL